MGILIEKLMLGSGDTENLRKLMLRKSFGQFKHHDRVLPSGLVVDDDAHSPFILQIPNFAPQESDVTASRPPQAHLNASFPLMDEGGPDDEDVLQSAPHTSPIFVANTQKRSIRRKPRAQKVLKKSKFGIDYPDIPSKVTKTIANIFASNVWCKRSRLGKGTISAIKEAGDLFLAQLGGDLSMLARHGGRRRVEELDVAVAMMR